MLLVFQMNSLHTIALFPLDCLLKAELKGARGDLKRPFDRSVKDYDTKFSKLEKERKAQAKEAGFIRSEVSAAEVVEELDPERKMYQLQMCEVSNRSLLFPVQDQLVQSLLLAAVCRWLNSNSRLIQLIDKNECK